MDDVSYPNEM